jgi:hypothetical protein
MANLAPIALSKRASVLDYAKEHCAAVIAGLMGLERAAEVGRESRRQAETNIQKVLLPISRKSKRFFLTLAFRRSKPPIGSVSPQFRKTNSKQHLLKNQSAI